MKQSSRNNLAVKIGLVVLFFILYFKPNVVWADPVTQTIDSQSDWLGGKYEFNSIDASTSAGFIHLGLDRGQWDASGPANINHALSSPAKILKVNQFLYLFRNGTGQLWRYDEETLEWKEMGYAPIEISGILDATTNGTDTIWAFATVGGRKHFMKYDVPTNAWSFMADAPNTLSYGDASLEYVAGSTNYIYAMRGGYTYEFWKYAVNGPNANTWSNIQNNTGYLDAQGDLIYDGNRYLYMATTWYSPDRFYQYDTWSGGNWVRKGDFPVDNAINAGSDLVQVDNDFYMLRTGATATFYKYTYNTNSWAAVADSPIWTNTSTLYFDTVKRRIIAYLDYGTLLYYYPDTNTWSQPLNGSPLNSSGNGSNFVGDGAGNFYICRGQGQTVCYKYASATNTWTTLTAAPAGLTYVSLAYYNNNLYITARNGSINNAIYSYALPNGPWTALPVAGSPPSDYGPGSTLVAIDVTHIFASRGNGSAQFYKFDGSTWTAKTNFPDALYYGSDMVNVGSTIYGIGGYNRSRLFSYTEASNAWTELAPLPVGSYIGGDMTYDGGDYIYMTTGGENLINGRNFYRYSISQNKWERIADTPQIPRNSGGMAYYNNSVYLYQGYAFGLYKYTLPTPGRTYTNYGNDQTNVTGNWFSPVYDLKAVESFSSFSKTDTTPEGTSVDYYSRSSDNQYAWDDWELADTNINSVPRRYLQLKIVLKGPASGMESPQVNSVSFSYNPDTTGPDMTAFELTAKSNNSGTVLTTGETYTHTHPYFEWTGASDTLSSIDGYYVYFGTNSSATPSTEGSYQNYANYTVSSGMTYGETYYLRIQAKDSQNNLSSVVNGFTYVYQGVSPATVSSLTNQADWDNNEASRGSVYSSSDSWWNDSYLYRMQLNLNPGVASAAGSIIKVNIDTDALVAAGKLRADRNDWRIVYKDNGSWREIDRQYFNPNETYFALQRSINAASPGNTDTNYYVYYGNADESSTPMSDLPNSNASSKWNGGLYFNGGAYLQVPNVINNLSQVTIEGWFKHLNPGGYRCMYGNNGGDEVSICVVSGNNYMVYSFKTSSGSVSRQAGTTFLEEEKWYHVAMTYDASSHTVNAYLNGRLDYTTSALTGNVTVAQPQRIGFSNGQYHYGYLDEIRISNNVRYTTDFTPPSNYFTADANTLILYHFDETGGQYSADSSGNNNNATWGASAANATNDPSATGFYTAPYNAEENKPATPADNDIKLSPLTQGSWAGYQFASLPFGARFHYGSGIYANNSLYVLKGGNTKTFYKYDLAANSWTQLADAPNTIYYNSMAYDGNDYIYALRGNNTTDFYRYQISTNTWNSSLTQPTANFGTGSIIIKAKDNNDNDVYFAVQGNGFNGFFIYNPATNQWVSKTSPPGGSTSGSGMVYDPAGKSIYLVTGQSFNFYKYSVMDDVWDSTATAPPLAPHPMGYASNDLVAYGNYLYFFSSYDYGNPNELRHTIWRYSKTNERWENVDIPTEFFILYGAVIYDGSRYVYLIQGSNSTMMVRFDLETNTMTPETPPLAVSRTFSEQPFHSAPNGTALIYDNSDSIYFFQGSSSYVNKYQVSTKRWTRLADLPCAFNGAGVYAANTLYAICGNTTKNAFKYDFSNSRWLKLSDSPDTIGANGEQIAVWNGANIIYVLRGRGTATLYRYLIDTDTWETESSTGGPTTGNSYGASITYDGSDTLYVFRGNNDYAFYKYKISAPAGWTQLASTPEILYYGSGSVYNNGKIYVTAGNQNRGLYVYDVATNSWSFGNFAPSQLWQGSAMVKGPGNSIYVTQGNSNYTFWKFNIPTSSTSFTYKGTFTSAPIALGNPYDFAGLTATMASPSATMTTFETRTSPDKDTWTDWQKVTGIKKNSVTSYSYNIASNPDKYIQVKATLESYESYESPSISDITVSYYDDQTSPSNPSTLASYYNTDKDPDQTLTTDTWYNKESPYFEWAGAADSQGGSGVNGYYVYFGQDTAAIASMSGEFQTEASYSAQLAVDGTEDGEYYLKIQSVDYAGNINSSVWSPFHYRYDHTDPQDVGTISIDPRTYTKTNSFAMSWAAISDTLINATSSGLLGYYYQASSSANILNDSFTNEASVSGILAYQEGSNTFNVRAQDNAGNTTSYKTASFYFNETPPTPPTNLGVDTSMAGANKFAFTWDPPTVIKGSVKEYRYSINSLPTADNTTVTSSTLVTNQKGTKSGANTFYIVAVDEAGNVDYNNLASIDFDVNISAPGAPLNPEGFDNSIRNTKSYRIGLTWDKPTDMGSAFDRYEIYTSETDVECSTSMDTYSLVGSTAGTSDGGSYVVTALNNEKLDSKKYYLCVLACSSSNQCSSPSTTINLIPTGRWLAAPDLVDKPSSTVKTKSASISWSTSRAANSFVKYGTSTGNYGEEVGSSDQVMAHTINLSNLSPGTTYYYKVLWTDEDGNQGESDENTLTTTAAPSVANVKFSNININSAYVSFTIKNASKATVQYGKTLSYGATESISTATSESTYTISLSNLIEGSTYHLRIAAEDIEANLYYSDDYTFETLPTPKVMNLRVQQVAGMPTATLRLLWSTNTLISSIVTYYPSGSSEKAVDQISLALKKSHEVVLKNLVDSTDYVLIIKGKDSAGNEATPVTKQIKTSSDMRPPEIQNLNVESTIVGVGESAKAQIVVSWDTDEPSSTQVEYAQGTGTAYGQTTQEDSNLTTNHTVTITGLTPAKIYHLRAVSKDKVDNSGQSFDTVIITPKSTKDALNLVIDNLSTTFGFLNNLKIFK